MTAGYPNTQLEPKCQVRNQLYCWDGSRGCKLLMRLDLCIATYA